MAPNDTTASHVNHFWVNYAVNVCNSGSSRDLPSDSLDSKSDIFMCIQKQQIISQVLWRPASPEKQTLSRLIVDNTCFGPAECLRTSDVLQGDRDASRHLPRSAKGPIAQLFISSNSCREIWFFHHWLSTFHAGVNTNWGVFPISLQKKPLTEH